MKLFNPCLLNDIQNGFLNFLHQAGKSAGLMPNHNHSVINIQLKELFSSFSIIFYMCCKTSFAFCRALQSSTLVKTEDVSVKLVKAAGVSVTVVSTPVVRLTLDYTVSPLLSYPVNLIELRTVIKCRWDNWSCTWCVAVLVFDLYGLNPKGWLC